MTGDKLMPKMHLRQLGFTYSACGPFIKNKEKSEKKIKNSKKKKKKRNSCFKIYLSK